MAASTKSPKEPADLEAEIEQLKADIAKLVSQLKTTGERSYGTARRAAIEGVDQLKATGEAYYTGLRSNADDLEKQIVDTIREKPFTALAVAAGVGFLFAFFARR